MDKDTLLEIGALWKKINEVERKQSNFTDKRVAKITPHTETKTAYIGDTQIEFDVPVEGNLSVFVKDTENNYPDFSVVRSGNKITVAFEPLEYVTTITISILPTEEE